MRGSIFDVGGMLMDGKTYFLVAGIIFTLVALFHLLRVFEDWPVMIADWSAPKWVSWNKSKFSFVLLGIAEPTRSDQHDHGLGCADGLFQRANPRQTRR